MASTGRLPSFGDSPMPFNQSTTPELTVVLKGVQAARSLREALARDDVQRFLDPSLVGRAQRRLTDFLSIVRGLQFLSTESPSRVNSVLAQLVARAAPLEDTDASELLALADDRRGFLDVLTRRLAARSPFDQVTVDFVEACERSEAGIAAERLDDIVTSLIEGMAAGGARHIRLGTETANDQLLVRLSADITVAAEAIGQRRLALYGRTLEWLGGSIEREQDAPTTFLLRLPEMSNAADDLDVPPKRRLLEPVRIIRCDCLHRRPVLTQYPVTVVTVPGVAVMFVQRVRDLVRDRSRETRAKGHYIDAHLPFELSPRHIRPLRSVLLRQAGRSPRGPPREAQPELNAATSRGSSAPAGCLRRRTVWAGERLRQCARVQRRGRSFSLR
jgi:hypothetical protein